jgi:hypothetical protein
MRHSLLYQPAYLLAVMALGAACGSDLAKQRNTNIPRESFDISRAVEVAVQATREAEVVVRATVEPTVGARVTSTGSSPRTTSTPQVEVARP